LEIDLEGNEEQPLSSFVCRHFISSYLNRPQFNRSEFGLLLNDLIEFIDKKEQLPKLVQTALQFKLDQWEIANKPFADVIQLLKTDIPQIYQTACIYRLVKNYPKDFQLKCLDKSWLNKFDQLKINTDGLNVDPFTDDSLFQSILNELSIFL